MYNTNDITSETDWILLYSIKVFSMLMCLLSIVIDYPILMILIFGKPAQMTMIKTKNASAFIGRSFPPRYKASPCPIGWPNNPLA